MKKIVFTIGFLLFFSGLLSAQVLQKVSGNTTTSTESVVVHPSKISKAIYHDVLPSLKDLPTVGTDYYIENKNKSPWNNVEDASGADYSNWKPMGDDPAWQKKMGTVNQPKALQQNFAGQSSPYMPSDCNGTVGPNHFFQTVNTTYAIYDKTGGLVAGPTAMNTLFSGVAGSSNNDGDPLILWDEDANRWVAVEFSISSTPYYMLVAISQTSDPTGAWDRWSFVMNGFPDYEKMGINQDGYFLATNTTSGDDVYVFDRSAMLAGNATPTMIQFDNPNRPNPSGFNTIIPIDCDGSWNTDNARYIAINDDAWGNSVNGGDELWIFDCVPDWTTPTNSTFGRSAVITVGAFDSQFNSWGTGDIEQYNESQLVDANPYVLMTRAQFKTVNGRQLLVCDHTVDVDGTNHAGIRWYQLEYSGGAWGIKQQGTYAPDAESRWMGSIAMNDVGQIALAYSTSSSSISPQIRYTGQTSCAPANTLDVTEQTITASNTYLSQPSYNRWGDYFLTTVDPSDNTTFWASLEYYNGGKKTQVFSFRIDESCNAPSITSISSNSFYRDKGKQITITGSDLLGCTFTINGINGTEVSNDGSTAVVNFPPANYDNTNLLVVSNSVGSDNTAFTVNSRTTIPVDAAAAANTDIHQTIQSAADGLFGWLGTNAFSSPYIIEVAGGTYTEGVTLNNGLNPTSTNTLTIQNKSGEAPIVDATGQTNGFNLGTVDYVTLKGFTVHSADSDNILAAGNNVTIRLNKSYSSVGGSGIKVTGTPVTVENNLVYSNFKAGIELNSDNNVVKNNTSDDNGGLVVHKTGVQLFHDAFADGSNWTTTDWALYTGSTGSPSGDPIAGISNATDYLTIAAPIDISGYTNITITTYYRSYGTLEPSDDIKGEYSFDGNNWTQFFSASGNVSSWTQAAVNNITPTSNNLYIRYWGDCGSSEVWVIDDIDVTGDEDFTDYYQGSAITVNSGTANSLQNNIFVAKGGNNAFYVLTSPSGVTVSSSYNDYYSTNTSAFNYNGTVGNTGPVSATDITSDPTFVGSGDYHLQSTNGSYTTSKAPIWPPDTQAGGVWSNDANDSPGLDAGNPADAYSNEPADNGGRINLGAYGNTAQASKAPPLPCITPTTQAKSLTATAASSSSIDLTWTRGDGDQVIVLAHQSAAVDADPVSGTSYTANSVFGSGSEIGTGNYVVYIGTGTNVTVTGLTQNTTYYFAAYEFNNTDVCYLTPGVTANATTPAAPPTITNVTPNSFFADKGKQLTITGSDLSGATVTLGGVTGTIVSNDGSTIVVDFPPAHYTDNTLTVSTGVSPDATETVTVNTRNVIPVGGGTDFHTTIQSALDGLYAWFGSNAFSTSTAGYLAGTKTIDVYAGTYTEKVTPNVNLGTSSSERLIIQNHTGDAPVIDATGLTNGVYIGSLDYVTVQGFTIHGSTDACLYTEGNYNVITYNRIYGSTAGSGIVLNTASNSTVTNNLITDNYNFGVRLISSDNVVFKNNTLANDGHISKAPPLPSVYDPAELYVESGTGTTVENNIFYAKSGTLYYTLKTEVGVTVASDYNTYFKNGNNNLVYYNGNLYADLAAWSGNGAGANDLESDPDFVNAGTDWHIKSADGSYQGGTWPPYAETGGSWVNDATTSPALDAGNPSDAYANEPQSGNRINQGAYGNTAQASKSPNTCVTPTTQASSLTATAASPTSIDLTWNRGDGDQIIILAHESAAVDANPVSGTSYTANSVFGSGSEIGTGNYVVYIGTATSVTVTGLTQSTTYYFAAYEFNNTDVCYLTPGVTDKATTPAAPPTITNVTPNSFFADKGKQLTITGSDLSGATVTLGGVTGTIVSNDGSTIVVDFPPAHYTDNTLTVSTGVSPDATETVTVNTRNVIPVGGGTDFHTTIQSALDGLYAWFGNNPFNTATAGYLAGTKTIDVYAGTYTEKVTPNVNLGTSSSERLIIQNHAGEAPVIDATGLTNGVYIGSLDYVTVQGFTIHGSTDACIYTEGDYNIITYNRVYGSTAGSGILLSNAASTSVTNNLVTDNYNFGVRLISSDNVVFKNNTLANDGHTSKAPPLPSVYDPAELYVESGTGITVENNIFYAKSGTNFFCLKTETGITVSSDYNTYFKNGNSYLVFYNGTVYADLAAWSGNGAGANDIETDPDFVNPGTDWHIKSTAGSYQGGTWPPYAETGGTWTNDATTSTALDAGNPADSYANEPQSGNRINQGAYGNTAQASKSPVVDIYWTGNVSTDWQDPNNWSPTQVPGSGNNAIIPDGRPNYPIIDDGTLTAVCFDLQIDANASVTIAYNGQMTVYGDITNSRGIDGLIIQSTSSGDGSLIENTTGISATVQRFLQTGGSNEWHFISPAITAESTTPYAVLYDYDETQDDWWTGPTYYFNAPSGWSDPPATMIPANGYIYYAGQSTLNWQGTLNADASYTLAASYTVHPGNAANGDPYTNFDGWLLAGNPYPCSLDWEALDKTNDITATVYYYDDNIDNYAYYQDGGTSVNGGSRYIPMGQAFFVKTNDQTDGGSLIIPAAARVHNDQGFWKTEDDEPQLLKLKVAESGYSDETVIKFDERAFDTFDDKFDAYKHFSWNYVVPQIFTLSSDRKVKLAINTFNYDGNRKVIPLGYKFNTIGTKTLAITENNLGDMFIIMHDNSDDSYTLMNGQEQFKFEINDELNFDRLELILEQNVAPVIVHRLNDYQTFTETEINFRLPDDFYVDANEFDNPKVFVSLADGSKLPEWLHFNAEKLTFGGTTPNVPVDFNIKITVVDMFGKKAQTTFNFKSKSTTVLNGLYDREVSLYPVPSNDKVYLNIGGDETAYDLVITSVSGQVVYSEEQLTNKETNIINVGDFAAGVYTVTIRLEDNSIIVKKIIVK